MNKRMTKKVTKKSEQLVKTSEVKGKMTVVAHYKDYNVEQDKELEVQSFDGPIAFVNAKYGLKLNLGNYETALCECGITLPTYVEEIPAAYKKAWAMIEEELQAQVSKVREVDKKTGK
jgi:hypothetical protein